MKNEKAMRFESRKGQNEKNEKKRVLQFKEKYFLYSLFWLVLVLCEDYFVELEMALL
jgi:hypothetical protein